MLGCVTCSLPFFENILFYPITINSTTVIKPSPLTEQTCIWISLLRDLVMCYIVQLSRNACLIRLYLTHTFFSIPFIIVHQPFFLISHRSTWQLLCIVYPDKDTWSLTSLRKIQLSRLIREYHPWKFILHCNQKFFC